MCMMGKEGREGGVVSEEWDVVGEEGSGGRYSGCGSVRSGSTRRRHQADLPNTHTHTLSSLASLSDMLPVWLQI